MFIRKECHYCKANGWINDIYLQSSITEFFLQNKSIDGKKY